MLLDHRLVGEKTEKQLAHIYCSPVKKDIASQSWLLLRCMETGVNNNRTSEWNDGPMAGGWSSWSRGKEGKLAHMDEDVYRLQMLPEMCQWILDAKNKSGRG